VVARINQLSFALDGINEVALTSKFVVFFFFNFLLHQNIHGRVLSCFYYWRFFFNLKSYLSSHLYVQIFFLGGDPMKINF